MSLGIDTDAILAGAALIFERYLKAELYLQGHNNKGDLIDSIKYNIGGVTLDVFALYYLHILNDGVKPENVSFAQFPHLVKYFKSKGDSDKTARAKAGATINTWKKTGMPTAGKKKLGAIDKAYKASEKEIERYIDKQVLMKLDQLLN